MSLLDIEWETGLSQSPCWYVLDVGGDGDHVNQTGSTACQRLVHLPVKEI